MNLFTWLVVTASCLFNMSINALPVEREELDQNRQLQTSSQVSRMQIDGWWASCGRLSKKCEGGFKAYGPELIDPTGETCYINPLRQNLGVVQWIAPLGNETSDKTFVYAVIFPSDLSDTYFPTNCTEAGACSCDTIEPLRAGWRENPTACGDDAIDCHIFPADLEAGRDCNVNAHITYSDPTEGTQSFCSWTISLAENSGARSMGVFVGSVALTGLSLVFVLAG